MRLLLAFFATCALVWPSVCLGAGSPATTRTTLFQAPFSGGGHVASDLRCTDGTPAAMTWCRVSSTADVWACTAPDGTAIPVTQGTGTTYETTPYGRAMGVRAKAQAAKLTASSPFASLWTADHTAIVVTAGAATNIPIPFSHGKLNVAGFYIDYYTPSTARFIWSYAGGAIAPQVYPPVGSRWLVMTGRKDGTSYTARVNGTSATVVNATPVVAPTQDMLFGTGWPEDTRYAEGPVLLVGLTRCPLTDASLAAFEAGILGSRASDGRPVSTSRAGPAWVRDSTGTAHQLGDNAPAVEPVTPGPLAGTNVWTDSTNLGAKTVQGSPTVALQVDGSWLIEDANGSSFQGVNQAGWAGAVGETWTLACEAKAGTSANVLLGLTGSDYCAGGTVLPADRFGVVSCTKTLTTATTIAFVYPAGPAGTNTGGAYFKSCWLTKTPMPIERLDCGATACTRGTPGEGDVQARNVLVWSNRLNVDEGSGVVGWAWNAGTCGSTATQVPAKGAGQAWEVTNLTCPIVWQGRYQVATKAKLGTLNGKWTLSCEMRRGTLTTGGLSLNGTNCQFENLTDEIQVKSCTTTVSGDPASFLVLLRVGYGANDRNIGSTIFERCQLEPGDVWSGTWIPTQDKPAERWSGGGLGIYGAVAQRLAHNQDLTAGIWASRQNVTTTRVAEATAAGGYVTRITAGAAGTVPYVGQSLGSALPNAERSIIARIRRVSGSGSVKVYSGWAGALQITDLTTAWRVVAFTYPARTDGGMFFELAGAGEAIDVDWTQVNDGPPGRRCDAGATAPVTCVGDVNTASAAGWPVASGEVSFYFTPSAGTIPASGFAYLIDTRGVLGSEGAVVVISTTGALLAGKGGGSLATSAPLAWIPGVPYHLRIRWSGTEWRVWRRVPGGVPELIASGSSQPLTSHGTDVVVGAAKTANSWANGSFYGIEVAR